jgi:regulatory protein YycI of two-component signal transduction system YycFG
MKNILIIAFLILLIFVGGYFFYNSMKKPIQINEPLTIEKSLTQPDRQAEINGYVTSIEGNELSVENEIGAQEITEEERAARQAMSQEERQALKAAESANMSKENVSVVLPVGVTIVKGSGDSSGTNVIASMEEIKKGIYVSIWQNDNDIEFVKLKGVSQ